MIGARKDWRALLASVIAAVLTSGCAGPRPVAGPPPLPTPTRDATAEECALALATLAHFHANAPRTFAQVDRDVGGPALDRQVVSLARCPGFESPRGELSARVNIGPIDGAKGEVHANYVFGCQSVYLTLRRTDGRWTVTDETALDDYCGI
jgi:hypothetical protein